MRHVAPPEGAPARITFVAGRPVVARPTPSEVSLGAPARFRVRFGEGDVFQFRIELEEITPVVWRRVAVSTRASLHELHGVYPACATWSATRILGHAFEIDGVALCGRSRRSDRWAAERKIPPRRARASTRRCALCATSRSTAASPGVTLSPSNRCDPAWWVNGFLRAVWRRARRCRSDDCDGPYDYQRLLTALREPLNPEAADLRTWLPDDFDPEYVDLVTINAALARIPKHRPAA